MNAKYIYSEPIMKVQKDVYVDANGKMIGAKSDNKAKYQNLPRYTVCSILTEDRMLQFGVARCSSKDRFDKKVGRELSFKRAIEHPVCKIQVPEELKISDVTRDVSMQLIRRIENERTFKF